MYCVVGGSPKIHIAIIVYPDDDNRKYLLFSNPRVGGFSSCKSFNFPLNNETKYVSKLNYKLKDDLIRIIIERSF